MLSLPAYLLLPLTLLPALISASPADALLARTTKDTGDVCYFPSHDIATGNVPCGEKGKPSHCCGKKSDCLPNGLCLVQTKDGLAATENSGIEYARGSCTDKSWGPACFQQCLRSTPGSPASNGAAIFQCGSKGFNQPQGANYCCENGVNAKDSCCSGTTFFLGPDGSSAGSVSSSTSSGGGHGGSSSTTTMQPTSAATAPVVSTTTVIGGSTYTLPCETQNGAIVVIYPSHLSCHTGCPAGSTTMPTYANDGSTPVTSAAGEPYAVPSSGAPSGMESGLESGMESGTGSASNVMSTPVVPSATSSVAGVPTMGGGSGATQPILVPNSEGNRVAWSIMALGVGALVGLYVL